MNHGTTIERLFSIWKDGKLSPQPYVGGDSSAKKGELVLFAFPDERLFTFTEVYLFFETEAETGFQTHFDGGTEIEFHVRNDVPLSECRIFRRWDKTPELDDFIWDFDAPPEVAYSEEFQAEAEEFLTWYANLPVLKK